MPAAWESQKPVSHSTIRTGSGTPGQPSRKANGDFYSPHLQMRILPIQIRRSTDDASSAECPSQSASCDVNPSGERDHTLGQTSSILLATTSAPAPTQPSPSVKPYVPHALSPQATVGIVAIIALVLAFILVGVALVCGCREERCRLIRGRKKKQRKAEAENVEGPGSPDIFNLKEQGSGEFTSGPEQASMDASDFPTERTPLLNGLDSTTSLPHLCRFEKTIYTDGEVPNSISISPATIIRSIEIHSNGLSSRAAETALLLLLCLRCLSKTGKDARISRSELEEFVIQKWTGLEDVETDETLHQMLWIPFPIEEGKDERQTVIEAILTYGSKCPLALSLDDRVTSSLLKTWSYGRPVLTSNSPVSTVNAFIIRLQNFVTPRVLFLMELALFFGYLGLVTNYIMNPPYHSIFQDPPRPDYRSYCLMIYAASRILRGPRSTPISFYCIILAFISALPSTPEENDSSYALLLLGFLLHIIQLLLPYSPSPVFLAPRTFVFPLSVIFHNLVANVLTPAFLFFLPVFLILFFLLSFSVADMVLALGDLTTALDPAPASTRAALTLLFLILLVLFCCLVAYMVLYSPSHPPSTNSGPWVPKSWDAYGPNIGLSVRQHFLQSVSVCSDPYFFPAPLNLLWFILVRLPHKVLHLFRQGHLAARVSGTLEPVLWRLVVVPPALVLASIYAWGLVA
ncbi:hypothetical protein M0805_001525 [Coniferiporia weirii]|nr:hypothetical protein M0805_001525 [Coniferiporia weirii]